MLTRAKGGLSNCSLRVRAQTLIFTFFGEYLRQTSLLKGKNINYKKPNTEVNLQDAFSLFRTNYGGFAFFLRSKTKKRLTPNDVKVTASY